MAKRGRPVGTRKREHAEAAARAILADEYADIPTAALAFFHLHLGRRIPFETIEAAYVERFRDFARYVDEALREILRTELQGRFRGYRALKTRYIAQSRQPSARLKAMNEIRQHLNEMLGWNLKIRDPN